VYPMVYNMVRLMLAEAARRQQVAADRIRFVEALGWLLDSKAKDELVPLKVNSDRSGQVESCVRKRRPKEFPVMKKPCSEWRTQLTGNTLAGYLSVILKCFLSHSKTPPLFSGIIERFNYNA